jgi:hypothetical protein
VDRFEHRIEKAIERPITDRVACLPVASIGSGTTCPISSTRCGRQFARSSAVGSRFDPAPSPWKQLITFV